MNKLKKLVLVSVLILILGYVVFGAWSLVHSVIVQKGLFGAGLPDVAQIYSTTASRSMKSVVKAAPARLFSCRIENYSAATKSFQLFDRTTNPPAGTVPTYAFELPGVASTIASPSVVTLDNTFFSPAIQFRTGLVWTISSNFNNYSSLSINNRKSNVTCLYE